MTLDEGVLQDVRASRDALEYCEDQVYEARARFHQEVRRLHAAGGSMREIATALGMSHQRVHQIIGEDGIVEVEATATEVSALPTSSSLAVTAAEDRCSFCGAPRRELDTLLAAPGSVFICSSCVERVGLVVHGELSDAARAVPAAEGATCSFCRSDSAVRGKMAESTRSDVRICARCIATCQQMMRTNEPRRPAMRRTAKLRCSFCNVSQTETRKLVAGPGVYICDGCIVAAGEVTRTGHRARGPRSAVLVSAITEEAPCQFCGKSPLAVGGMARGGRGRICDECIELCVDVLSEEAGRQ